MQLKKIAIAPLRRGLPDTVAETVGVTHRRGLCPKHPQVNQRKCGVQVELRVSIATF
ncbi:MAG: hypothetical protein RMZ69_15350 [Nostoc sp. ChiQUE01a]|nr:hypothetical protein [Nostoc sp. ChiQUE01a]